MKKIVAVMFPALVKILFENASNVANVVSLKPSDVTLLKILIVAICLCQQRLVTKRIEVIKAKRFVLTQSPVD